MPRENGRGIAIAGRLAMNREPKRPTTACTSARARLPGPWVGFGRASMRFSTRLSDGTRRSNAIACSRPACRCSTSSMAPRGHFEGRRPAPWPAYLWSQTRAAEHQRTREDGRSDRAGLFQCRSGDCFTRFQEPRLFSIAQPHRRQVAARRRTVLRCSQATHHPLCCTAALNRILPNYVMHMWMATYDNGLAAMQYGPCKVSALAADRIPVEITCHTDYPFNEVIEMSVNPAREATFPLSLRIPGWCRNPELSVNGSGVRVAPDAKGFLRIERLWNQGRRDTPAVSDVGERGNGGDSNAGRALRVDLLWPAAVRPSDSGCGSEHTGQGCQMAVRIGQRCDPAGRRHPGGA